MTVKTIDAPALCKLIEIRKRITIVEVEHTKASTNYTICTDPALTDLHNQEKTATTNAITELQGIINDHLKGLTKDEIHSQLNDMIFAVSKKIVIYDEYQSLAQGLLDMFKVKLVLKDEGNEVEPSRFNRNIIIRTALILLKDHIDLKNIDDVLQKTHEYIKTNTIDYNTEDQQFFKNMISALPVSDDNKEKLKKFMTLDTPNFNEIKSAFDIIKALPSVQHNSIPISNLFKEKFAPEYIDTINRFLIDLGPIYRKLKVEALHKYNKMHP